VIRAARYGLPLMLAIIIGAPRRFAPRRPLQTRAQRGARVRHAVCVSRNTYFIAPILKIFVLQTGQVPSVAGRPFFIVICLALLISRWALHFMQ
jgi:hypothetical protein